MYGYWNAVVEHLAHPMFLHASAIVVPISPPRHRFPVRVVRHAWTHVFAPMVPVRKRILKRVAAQIVFIRSPHVRACVARVSIQHCLYRVVHRSNVSKHVYNPLLNAM
jgi:hypothetical protein